MHRTTLVLAAALAALATAGCKSGQPKETADAPISGGAPLAAPASSPGTAAAPARDTTPAKRATADTGHAGATSGTTAAGTARTASMARDTTRLALRDTATVRALYVNRWAAQSPARIRALVAIADSTEINGLVIDMKDEFGLNFQPADAALAKNAGTAGKVPNPKALVDTLKAHHIVPIARLVVFKDSVAARANPEHVIRKPDGSAWRDKKGLTWVDPYDHAVWEYNIRVAEEMARAGFEEIQFDYIRFPEPYRSLPPQVFKDANGVSKPRNLADFFRAACPRLHALGARCTADIFGLVTTVPGALEVGQEWEQLAPVADVLLPMVYPSHYPRGAFGIARPNAEPYRVVHTALARARERDAALGIAGTEHVRPYLQAFSLKGMEPKYGPEQLRQQKQATYDAGYDGWVLWSPGSQYEAFVPGLEKTLASRRQAVAATTTASRSR